MYATKVIDAYKKGDLTLDNIDEWETEYNGGIKPNRPTNLYLSKATLEFADAWASVGSATAHSGSMNFEMNYAYKYYLTAEYDYTQETAMFGFSYTS